MSLTMSSSLSSNDIITRLERKITYILNLNTSPEICTLSWVGCFHSLVLFWWFLFSFCLRSQPNCISWEEKADHCIFCINFVWHLHHICIILIRSEADKIVLALSPAEADTIDYWLQPVLPPAIHPTKNKQTNKQIQNKQTIKCKTNKQTKTL